MALFKELHGQAVRGEMLVDKRVWFSGTPSPECWILMYRILRVLKDYWAVEQVLQTIATMLSLIQVL